MLAGLASSIAIAVAASMLDRITSVREGSPIVATSLLESSIVTDIAHRAGLDTRLDASSYNCAVLEYLRLEGLGSAWGAFPVARGRSSVLTSCSWDLTPKSRPPSAFVCSVSELSWGFPFGSCVARTSGYSLVLPDGNYEHKYESDAWRVSFGSGAAAFPRDVPLRISPGLVGDTCFWGLFWLACSWIGSKAVHFVRSIGHRAPSDCSRCGYPIHGLPICPECGTPSSMN